MQSPKLHPGCHSMVFPHNNFWSILDQAFDVQKTQDFHISFAFMMMMMLSMNKYLHCFVHKVNELDIQTQNLRTPPTASRKINKLIIVAKKVLSIENVQ